MKPIVFATLLFLASSGLALPSAPQTKGLPPPPPGTLTKGLPPPSPSTLTKGLPPPPPSTQTKGLPPPPPTTLTKGLPPPPPSTQTKGLPPSPPTTLDEVKAQLQGVLPGLSQSCGAALLSIFTNPDFLKCVPITAIIPILPIILDPTAIENFLKDPSKATFRPIETPFIQFSKGFCVAPKCSNDLVAGAIKTINDGCKDEIKKKVPIITTLLDVAVFYSPIHDSICFQDKKKTFCWDESITTAISLPPSPIKIVGVPIIDAIAVADPPKVCTPCNRAIINTFGNFLKKNQAAKQVLVNLGVNLGIIQTGIAVKCGINFENGDVGDPGK